MRFIIYFLLLSFTAQAQETPVSVRGKIALLRGKLCYNTGSGWVPIADSSAVTAASASFATVTGQPTDNANLSAALSAKVPNTLTVQGQALSGNITIPGSSITGIPIASVTGYTGYTLPVQGLTSSPTDAQTIYFGYLPKQPVTTAATSKIYIRKAGTIKMAEIYCYSGTAGTNEAWPVYIRLNNTTDTQIASLSVATSERVFSNTGLSIAVAVGDYIEIKAVNPTWVTNPLTTIRGGYIYIE